MTEYEYEMLLRFNKSLEKPNEPLLCNFLSEYARLLPMLDEKVRIKAENYLLKGIRRGKLNYVTGKITGRFSKAATLIPERIEIFALKEKFINAARLQALKSRSAQNYAIQFFHEFVSLDCEENLKFYSDLFNNEKALKTSDYAFLRSFIVDKSCESYEKFREKIERFESKHVAPERRIPEVSNLPF